METRAQLIDRLLASFIQGPDRSLALAGQLEVALDEEFPDDDECQDLMLMLASYRPGGGEYLYDETAVVAKCARVLQHLHAESAKI